MISRKHYRKNLMYGDFLICAPDGEPLSRTTEKRINWYLERGLAERKDEKTIHLNFEPKSRSKAKMLLSGPKENRCVICGGEKKLNRHHIVPCCFRSNFPEEFKRGVWDVLLTCSKCHNEYERFASELKKELSNKYDVGFHGMNCYLDKSIYLIARSAKSLLYRRHKIPEHKCKAWEENLKLYLKKDELTKEDLLKLSKLKPMIQEENYVPFGKALVLKLSPEEIIPFIKMWRQHFLDHAKPQFMPANWHINCEY